MKEIRNYRIQLKEQKKEIENDTADLKNSHSPMHNNSKAMEHKLAKSIIKGNEGIRHNAINNIMEKETKLKEIDEQLEMFKDNFHKF